MLYQPDTLTPTETNTDYSGVKWTYYELPEAVMWPLTDYDAMLPLVCSKITVSIVYMTAHVSDNKQAKAIWLPVSVVVPINSIGEPIIDATRVLGGRASIFHVLASIGMYPRLSDN